MDARADTRGGGGAAAGKKTAVVRTKASVAGLKHFKNRLFTFGETEQSRPAIELLYGMIQRNAVINEGLVPPTPPSTSASAAEVPPPPPRTLADMDLSDETVLRKTNALVAMLYEWNHRAFVKLPMADTLQLLHRLGRDGETHMGLFEQKQRLPFQQQHTFAAAWEAQHDEPTALPGGGGAATGYFEPTHPDDLDRDVPNYDHHAWPDDDDEMPPLPTAGGGAAGNAYSTTTGGVGLFIPDDFNDDDLFIEA